MSILGRLHRMKDELSPGDNDPWRRVLERALPSNLTCTSTVALLDVLNFAATTGNARRLARTMRIDGLGRYQVQEARAWRLADHRVPGLGASITRSKTGEGCTPCFAMKATQTFRCPIGGRFANEASPYVIEEVIDRSEIRLPARFLPLAPRSRDR